jgi:hypothetical protein
MAPDATAPAAASEPQPVVEPAAAATTAAVSYWSAVRRKFITVRTAHRLLWRLASVRQRPRLRAPARVCAPD